MKKSILPIGCLLLAFSVVAQQQTCETGECSCASCTAKKKGTFTLPALKGLEQENVVEEHSGHDHGCEEDVHLEHTECDHGVVEAEHEDHSGHDHGAEEAGHTDHAGCDHGAEVESAIGLSPEIVRKIGLQVRKAKGGTISKSVVFPAEIQLNRDRSAAVSPRYPSMVRQVFTEIGDAVKKGDVMASLENRETMAVYTVSAPLAGVVISKNLSVGESVDEDHVLFEVADLSSVWADISIFPQYRHLIRKGLSVTFIAHDGHTTQGAIEYVSPLVSLETRTLQARCVLEGAGEDFAPGAFVRAEIAVQTCEASVCVEKEAVQVLDGRTVVFIADEHGFETRDVEVGLSDRSLVEIKTGLKHGEMYVAKGAFELKAEIVTSGLDPHAGHGH